MNARNTSTAIGAGLTTFLLVTVLVIELLAVEFSAIVGIPAGILAGSSAAVGVLVGLDGTTPATRRAVRAYAVFGPTVLALLLVGYVNVGRISIEVVVGTGIVAVCGAYVLLYLVDRTRAG